MECSLGGWYETCPSSGHLPFPGSFPRFQPQSTRESSHQHVTFREADVVRRRIPDHQGKPDQNEKDGGGSNTIDRPPPFNFVGADDQRTMTTIRRVDGRSRNSQR